MKKLSILFLFIPFVAMGQIWPTDVQYQFLNGIYAGNYGNLHITSDGDIDTIKGSAYDWPDSLRVVDAGKRYYLTGVYSGGQYDMDWRRPSKADVSDLTANQVLVGGANGEIAQSSALTFTDDGATSTLTTTGADNAEVDISSTSVSTLSLYVDPLDFHIANDGVSFFLRDQISNKTPFVYNSSNFRIGFNTLPAVDFHVVADTVRFEGLDGAGSRLAIDDDGNITRTANSSTYQITLVAADQVNASSNEIIGITGGNFTTVAQASRRKVNMTHDGSFTFASVGLATTQPATGDLVLTLYKNGSATSMVLTIPASSALGSYITTTETVTFVEGDYFYWYATNGASTNSGLLNSVSLLTHYTP